MKKLYTILCLCLFMASFATAQERYKDDVFTDVTVTSDVTYGVNATLLFLAQAMEAVPQELKLDVYEPTGDNVVNRPLFLVFHTGNFLPNVTNAQIAGTKTDSSAVEICTQLARKGFVAASVTYRAGWNPLAGSQPERALGLIQAAYRGLQDGRNAIRYFRHTVANEGNPYGIDDTKIACLGTGTGGYLVLGMAGLSDYNEILTTTNGPGKFLLDTNGDNVPETPMVIPPFHGDINGEVLTVTPADGSSVPFGLPPGDTTNYVNYAGFSNDFNLCINIGGALGDISWLNDQTVPIISIQSAFDQFAPYDDAVLIVPNTGDPIVQVQGAQQIGMTQEGSGINQAWKDAMFDDPITQLAMANSAIAGHPYYEGTFPYVQAPNSLGIDEGIVIDWWDPAAPSPADGQGMGIPWNQLPHPSGGTFHDQGLVLNEGMSAEKARANIDTCMQYILPRALVTLDPAMPVSSSTEDILDAAVTNLQLAPNPTFDRVMLTSSFETPMLGIELYDMSGRLLVTFENLDATQYELDLSALTKGLYVAKVRFEQGIQSHKIMLK